MAEEILAQKPRALDLFCGAGGVSVGLARAGFHVTGVDLNPKVEKSWRRGMEPYGGEFFCADALTFPLEGYDFIWASPPCQAYSAVTIVAGDRERRFWAIENVPGSPLRRPVTLCGTSFHLGALGDDGVTRPLRRHRLVEASWSATGTPCRCDGRQALGVYGHGGQNNRSRGRRGGYQGNVREAREALGINWMTRDQLTQAIPPAYSEWIGRQALEALKGAG